MLNNNLAQVVQALGGAKDGQGIHVSLFAVANCFGRLLAGYLPQYALNNAGIVRPWFLALLGLMTSGSALFNAFASLRFMIIGTILTGETHTAAESSAVLMVGPYGVLIPWWLTPAATPCAHRHIFRLSLDPPGHSDLGSVWPQVLCHHLQAAEPGAQHWRLLAGHATGRQRV